MDGSPIQLFNPNTNYEFSFVSSTISYRLLNS